MAKKITITLEALPEDESPEHSEQVTKSAPGYAKAVREVMKMAEGRWGWCCVKVIARVGDPAIGWHTLEKVKTGTSHLGNCSYLNAEDFVKNSGYFDTLVNEAIEDAVKERVATVC